MDKGLGTRARILDEAVRLASREGLEGLSIGSLAAALAMSKSGLFAHFGSKETLQIAVLEHAAELFRARNAQTKDLPDGPEQLRALLRTTLDWIDDPERPGGCPIAGACFEFDDQEGPVRQALLRLQERSQQWAVATFRTFAEPSQDPEQLAFEFKAIALGYHHAARVMRAPQARTWAGKALEALIERAFQPEA